MKILPIRQENKIKILSMSRRGAGRIVGGRESDSKEEKESIETQLTQHSYAEEKSRR